MFEQVETFGQYALKERLAVGGMAEIFRASIRGASGVERIVAIKRIHRHLEQDENLVNMLVDEARLAVHLRHPNVGQVFDLGCIDGQHFLVMEYISGVDLHRVLRRIQEQQRHIPTAMVLYTMIEMLAGLHYAHELCGHDGKPLNVVHRDISPQNIMFSMNGGVKLIDFGIAKARSQVMHTQAGIIKGKFYYMSPEQAHGQTLDRRCDVFAAGMVMYELLTGRPAYEELGDVALLRKVRACDFEPPSHWRQDLDPNLEVIVMKALTKDLRQRFQSAHEFRAALQHYARHHFPPISRDDAASFVQRLLEPEQVERRTSRAERAMPREDFNATGDSLIFDASHLAMSMEADAVVRPEPRNNFAAQLPPDENPFASADEPTYVYAKEDENPFAIPDEITSPVQRTAPNRRKTLPPKAAKPSAPAQQKPPRTRPPTSRLPSMQRAAPQPPSRKIKIGAPVPPPVRATGSEALAMHVPVHEATDPAIVDDVTTPRRASDVPGLVDLSTPAFEPTHNPDYVAPISLEPAPGTLGPREVTQITKPAVGALQFGFRATSEGEAFDRDSVMAGSSPQVESQKQDSGPLAPLFALKASLDTSPHRAKILIAAACVLVIGMLFPFVLSSSDQESTQDVIASEIPSTPDSKEQKDATLAGPRRAILSINTAQGDVEVLVDGKFVGTTPKILDTLHVGDSPKITLRLKGYETWEERVAITSTTPDPLSISLEKSMLDGIISVKSKPSNLAVMVDGKQIGTTPLARGDFDRSRSYEVVVQHGSSSVKKLRVVSWQEDGPLEQEVFFEFEPVQGDSALPDAPTPKEIASTKKTRRPPKKRKRRRDTSSKPTRSTSSDASINVWGGGGNEKTQEKTSDSLNVWGGKKKSSGTDSGGSKGYLTVKVTNGDGMIYVNGKLVKRSSPLVKHSLAPGKYKVHVRYTMLKRDSSPRTVTIKAGKSKTVTFKP